MIKFLITLFWWGALFVVMGILLIGCITNNSYTNSGEGDPKTSVGETDFVKTDAKVNSNIESEISGFKHVEGVK